MKKILIIVTNHPTIGDTKEANGTFIKEVTHALKPILGANYEYDIASIKGGKAPIYGDEPDEDKINKEILSNADFQNKINNTIPLSQLNPLDYQAIYYPGGFGLLSDLVKDDRAGEFAAKNYDNGGIISAVCHGPGCLLPIVLSSGEKLLADKSVTGFSREEEVGADTIHKIPFLLEEELTKNSGKYSKVQPWKEHVVEDGRVITGQNPASAYAVGVALVKKLNN